MTLLIVLLSVYILSVLFAYKFMQKAHSIGGIWYPLDTDWGDVFFTICPLLNILPAINYFFSGWKMDNNNYNNFFRVNK